MGETVNPVTGLTQKEIQTVQDVWRMANQDRRELAYDLFDTFFNAHPETRSYFPTFKDLPLNEIRGNKKILGHAYTVMYTMSSLLDNLDDPECLDIMLLKHGKNHAHMNIDFKWFIELGRIIGGCVKQRLGSDFDDFAETAFHKSYGYMLRIIKIALDQKE